MANLKLKQRLKKSIYIGLSLLFKCTGIPLIRHALRKKSRLTVLMYHKINNDPVNTISVAPDLFDRQLQFLKARHTVIDADTLIDFLDNGRPLPDNPVLLTFDDGYKDNLTQAYPILKKHGLRALLFIPTDFPGKSQLPHDEDVETQNPTLSWEDIQSIADVFEIGSHGCSHTVLTRMPIHDALAEIQRSREILQEKLGGPVRAFSYPKGTPEDFNDELESGVRECGYQLAFTTIPQLNGESFNRFAVSRYNVEDFGMLYFRLLLDGSSDILGIKETSYGHRLKKMANRILGTTSK